MERSIGVLGGGQLGRMLTEAANNLNIKIVTLDVESAPAKQVAAHAEHVVGSFRDRDAIHALAKKCDVLTVEIEHVDTVVLEGLEGIVEVQPSWQTIRLIQDKFRQKEHLLGHGIDTVDSLPIHDASEHAVDEVGQQLGYPFMLKSRTDAYDGRGNYLVESARDIRTALDELAKRPLYAERLARFKAELAVMVVKTADDVNPDWTKVTLAYPVVETEHEDSICKLVYAPARGVSSKALKTAAEVARRTVATLWGKGVFGVELFLLDDGEIDQTCPRAPWQD